MTNNLSRANNNILFAVILMFAIISIYPILNFIITKDFIDEFTLNVSELSLTYQIKGNVALNFGANYLRSTMII